MVCAMSNFHRQVIARSVRRMRRWLTVTLASAALLPGLTSTEWQAHAEQAEAPTARTAPLWEIGIGGGVLYGADYPAADEQRVRGLGLPYVVYRGDVFRLGDDSLARGLIVDEDFLEIDISVDASFDVDSDNNLARRGMPDLDYLFEVGPQAIFDLGNVAGGKVTLGVPARAVFSTDFRQIDYRGVIIDPELSYARPGLFGTRFGFSASLGIAYAQERLQDYFYGVDPEFRIAGRPAHDASGGYLGTNLTIGFAFPVSERLVVYAGSQLSFHGSAANSESPLYRDRFNWSIGSGLTLSLYESETRVAWKN